MAGKDTLNVDTLDVNSRRFADRFQRRILLHPRRDPIHQYDGSWYFWDEIGCDRYGPYPDEETARQKLEDYIFRFLNSNWG